MSEGTVEESSVVSYSTTRYDEHTTGHLGKWVQSHLCVFIILLCTKLGTKQKHLINYLSIYVLLHVTMCVCVTYC